MARGSVGLLRMAFSSIDSWTRLTYSFGSISDVSENFLQ